MEIVNALVKADKRVARQKDNDGKMPLHVALCYGQSHDVVEKLFRLHPEAGVGCTCVCAV